MHNRYIHMLTIAELQFKLALQVSASAHSEHCLQQPLVVFSFGGYHIERDDLSLTEDESQIAASALEHCATHLMAVVIDTALEHTIPNRFESLDMPIVHASRIARLLRNAFAHNPLLPVWHITNENHRGQFEIPGVISIDARHLHGLEVDWRHYGGPLALLKFLAYTRSRIRDLSA